MKIPPHELAKALADATAHAAGLSRENAELQSVLGAMREAVVAVGPDERITRVNAAAAPLLGMTADSARGRLLGESLRHPVITRVARAGLSGKVDEGEMEIFVPAKNASPGGSSALARRLFQVRGTPMPGRTGAVLVLHDVTQLRRLEVVRQDFVANASHEIKTPVAAIQGVVETLADAPEMNETDRARFMDILTRQTSRLSKIIEDLLTLSRIERGLAVDLAGFSPEPLAPIGSAAVEACAPRANAAKVLIEADFDAGLALPCDPSMIERALVNLLENAIKYGGSGGRVAFRIARENNQAVLEVRDFGAGISSEHLPRIFERFYRTDKARSREQGGTGLGLSIVKHIAESHGGRVSVESSPGAGATFRIHLPLAPPPAALPA